MIIEDITSTTTSRETKKNEQEPENSESTTSRADDPVSVSRELPSKIIASV